MPALPEPPALLPDRIRLPLEFEPAALEADVAQLGAGDWTRHFVKANYEGEWSALPLRAAAGETHPLRLIYPNPQAAEFVDTAYLDRMPHIREALTHFKCPLRCVRLMRLGPGSRILEHCDPDLDAESGSARLHVPITGASDVEFVLNHEPVAMSAGSVWYLRLSDPHRAHNRGTVDRINLVIDAKVDAWLAAMLQAGAARGISDVP